jgi:hypothetical protein
MKTNEYFIKKRDKIRSALNKTSAILSEFQSGVRPPEFWNNAHRLYDNLSDRFNQNEKDFSDHLIDCGVSHNYGNVTLIF